MSGTLFKTLVTSVFAFIIIFFYYSVFGHNESFSGSYLSYMLLIGLTYGAYKWYHIFMGEHKVRISFPVMISFFLLHLFFLSALFFGYNDQSFGYGISLFFKIIFFLFLPVLLSFLFYSVGKKSLSLLSLHDKESSLFTGIVSFGLGFTLFITFVTILGFLGFYSSISTLLVIGGLLVFSYREFLDALKQIVSVTFEFDNHQIEETSFVKKYQPYLLSTELFFVMATALISINLINIVRPFPIGWDDLGVYMNYPHLLAQAGEVFSLGQMMTWQIFTGIGFAFGSMTQAFFLNSFAGILTFGLIYLTFHYFFEKGHDKKFFFNIPLLFATIYLSLPMVIFHLAKDMKLDQGLFFISIIAFFVAVVALLKKDLGKKELISYMLLAGIFAGIAFSIKVTTLLLISSIIGIFFFSRLGLMGFLGYMSLYFSIFTYFGLWSLMNVVYPSNDTNFINNFSLVSLLVGAGFLSYAIFKHKNIVNLGYILGSFLVGILIILSPWFLFNISSVTSGNISISKMLGGEMVTYVPDYTNIHNEEYIESIKAGTLMTSSGTATNEDLGRYFGYEKGISNYVKLPWNLTMQVNQGGEFTDIGYIFLAFLPTLLLFLPVRRAWQSIPLYAALGFFVLFVMKQGLFTPFLESFLLPYGYGVILALFLGVLIYLYFTLDLSNHKHLRLFYYNMFFTAFYVFLWTISAFGIVWYGIMMYYVFFLSMAFGLYYLFSYHDEMHKKELFIKGFCSFVILFWISIYFFLSAIPHGFNNLKSASYTEYKIGRVSETESIFAYHPEYLSFLYEMNISEEGKKKLFEDSKEDLTRMVKTSKYSQDLLPLLGNISNITLLERLMGDIVKSEGISDIALKGEVRKLRESLYKTVSSPKKEFENNKIIYRVGTFMKYFITKNNERLFDDSLLFEFPKYYYDKTNRELAPERMKKMGMEYLLVDLNAATIDQSPDGDLTKRYEMMLDTFMAEKLELVGSDSMCLNVAMEEYKASKKTSDDENAFLRMAGVNYNGVAVDGNRVTKQEKLVDCFNKIHDLVNAGKVNDTNYAYLLPIANYLQNPNNGIKSEQDLMNFYMNYVGVGFKALFKIK